MTTFWHLNLVCELCCCQLRHCRRVFCFEFHSSIAFDAETMGVFRHSKHKKLEENVEEPLIRNKRKPHENYFFSSLRRSIYTRWRYQCMFVYTLLAYLSPTWIEKSEWSIHLLHTQWNDGDVSKKKEKRLLSLTSFSLAGNKMTTWDPFLLLHEEYVLASKQMFALKPTFVWMLRTMNVLKPDMRC